MKKGLSFALIFALLAALLSGCAGTAAPAENRDATSIILSGGSAQITGGGAAVKDNVITISAVGTYCLSGKLDDGQVIIDTGDEKMDVTLILNGADVTCLTGPAIQVNKAKNVRIELAAGTENLLTSGTEADMNALDETASGAVIFSEADLDIEGEGTLSILGFINNGVTCKDDLDINGGNINVFAANNGIRGSESVEIKGGNIAVTAGNDGVKSTSAKKDGKGFVAISGGNLAVSAKGDGISAETELRIEGGVIFAAVTGTGEQQSSKAIKANAGLIISGGAVTLEAADHAVHSGAGIEICGGALTVSSAGGKAIAAHGDILISGGEISLNSKEDGLETPGGINISGGALRVISGADCLQAGEANSGRGYVSISGGELILNAGKMSVNARGGLSVTGGVLFALSGADKSLKLSECTQSLVLCSFSGAKGETVALSFDGAELMSDSAEYAYSNVLVSLPELSAGNEYSLSNGRNQINAEAK